MNPPAPHDVVSAEHAELWRPQFHFTPERNWMNDPNGLVYVDGEYHLFYQYNPFGDTWGHMSWGHAVSPDLVHWEHLPPALAEEDGVMIFSGCAVVDWENTSGFGRAGMPPMVAVYTGHHTERPLQNQCLAFSKDRGRTWTKHPGNPVLDTGERHFRDPKVFWHEPDRRWVMAVALPDERKIQFYGSRNLREWTHLSDFGPAGSTTGIWECPDMFPLPVDGDSRWVLVVSVATGAPAGGSGTQYFVGRFDGTRFTPDEPDAPPLWADYGRDFYAATSWSGIPAADGRRVLLGWMSNWDYARDVPTSPWRGAMTVPRFLSLVRTPDGLRLTQQPVAELRGLRLAVHRQARLTAEDASAWLAEIALPHGLAEIAVDLAPGTARRFGLRLRHGDSGETAVVFDLAAMEMAVDRSRSGESGFAPEFAGIHSAPVRLIDGRLSLVVLCDTSSLEVFVNGGETVITDLVLPRDSRLTFEIFADSPDFEVESVELWEMESARR